MERPTQPSTNNAVAHQHIFNNAVAEYQQRDRAPPINLKKPPQELRPPPSNLKKLPQEIRLQIYAHDLVHYPSVESEPPALLKALAGDEFFVDDYVRAVRLYSYGGSDMNNFKVTKENTEAFNRMPMKEMLKIRHLTLVMKTDELMNQRDSMLLKSNKCKLKNNFESIIVDLKHYGTMINWAGWVAKASSRPYRIIVRIPRAQRELDLDAKVAIAILSETLVMRPTIESEGATHDTWIWDGGDKTLRPINISTFRPW